VWLATLFSGVLAFNRSFQVELESGALEPLLQYPGPRWTIFAGKLLGNMMFLTLMVAIVVPAGIVLFGVRIPADWLSLLGVLALAVGDRQREPVSLPLERDGAALEGQQRDRPSGAQ
jgi:ABC-type transport system involved in cytochrome c biogenesis permease component